MEQRLFFCEPTLEARQSTAAEVFARTGAVLVHPFDDDRVIAGQGHRRALEFWKRSRTSIIICAPVSGGGLLSGTAIAAKSLRPDLFPLLDANPQLRTMPRDPWRLRTP